jgi:nitrile hydratase accessory protein
VSTGRYARYRNIVHRADGRPVNVARFRGQLFVCASGCCCGRVDDGFAPVPADLYHREWERRRLRNVVHLTIGGCLGPCALANVVLLLFDGQAQWFQSVNSDTLVIALYDHIERMLEADGPLPVPAALAPWQFTASAWQARPDGQPVEDARPRRWASGAGGNGHDASTCPGDPAGLAIARAVAGMAEVAALPRRNGELVFDAPWQGRAFGMAVALHEQGAFTWEEFRTALIAEITAAEARGGRFEYYEAWLAALEGVLAARTLVRAEEVDETTFQFEFGERDDAV